ncbi:hypothetical protein, partial [Vibrio vulnificus]|uniref:hypothetical protein n=2 Tax=Vibrio vulnificus TaxID=672 RepID=UPI0039B683A2
LDSNLEYRLEIFDSNDKRHFSEMYWAKNKYRYAFNPPESGIYTLRFTGKSNHGDFRLETKQYNLDSQLRGEANVIAPGDMVENKLARNSVAEYRLNVQGNSPIEFIAQPLDSNLEYRLEIFDSNDKRHFSEMYWAKNKYRYAFNPPESGIYTLR